LRMEVIGYQAGGLTGQSPRLGGLVGSNSDWRNLINSISGNDALFFRRDYVRVCNGASGVRGWNLSQNISEEVMGMHNDTGGRIETWPIGFIDYNYFRFFNPPTVRRTFERDLNRFDSLGIVNISFDVMAQMLNSAHGRHAHTRTEMIALYREMLQYGTVHGLGYAFHDPNMYMWDKSNIMFDMPITSSGFTILSYDVPFMQILLSGHAELFAPHANFQPSRQDYLLRLVEFGVRPSYFLTWESPTLLHETDSNWIHSSEWSVWQTQIEDDAVFLADATRATQGATFISHRRLDVGVYESVFSNSTAIIVNHTHAPFTTAEGILVPPRQYIVR